MRKFPSDYLLHPSSSGYVKVLPTKVLPAGLLTVAPALVMAKGSAKVLPSESISKAVVAEFLRCTLQVRAGRRSSRRKTEDAGVFLTGYLDKNDHRMNESSIESSNQSNESIESSESSSSRVE